MPPTPGLFEIVLLQLIVLFCLRCLGPVLWQPHIAGASGVNGWLLLPKGILGIGLVLVGGGLLSLLNRTDARLLQQLVVVDLLVYGLLTASLTGFMLQQQDKGQPTGSSG